MPADIIDEEMDAVRGVGAPVHRLVGVPFNGCGTAMCCATRGRRPSIP